MYKAKLVGRYGHIMYVANDTKSGIEQFAIGAECTIEEIRKTTMMKVSKTFDGKMNWC